MHARRMLVAGVLGVGLLGARHEDAGAAQCPSECRTERNEVICSETLISRGDQVVVVERRFWSNGAY